MSPPCLVQANDGFFWGAGDTLRPIQNKNLRVISEELRITPIDDIPCYEVLYRGKPGKPSELYNEKAGEFATIGRRLDCAALKSAWAKFSPKWTAEAIYEIEALADAPDVLFGFPVHNWYANTLNKERLTEIPAPGVVNFRTYIDDNEAGPLRLKWLDGVGAAGVEKTLGYTWKASFVKGRRYALRTTYEFGVDESNAFYAGREYLKGEPPWFAKKGYWSGTKVERLIYYLTPLRQWASPPPSRVSIAVGLPGNVPVELTVPAALKPVCIAERSLFYALQDAFPARDLEVSYADGAGLKQGIRTPQNWEAWIKTMGGPKVEIECALLKRLKTEARSDLQTILAGVKCRPSCGSKIKMNDGEGETGSREAPARKESLPSAAGTAAGVQSTYDWNAADAYCRSNGGRLPAPQELRRLYKAECANGQQADTCKKWYWSSEEFGASEATGMRFYDGDMHQGYKSSGADGILCMH